MQTLTIATFPDADTYQSPVWLRSNYFVIIPEIRTPPYNRQEVSFVPRQALRLSLHSLGTRAGEPEYEATRG